MATPSEKLAESLNKLRDLQELGIVAIHTRKLSRTHRERLLENGFLKEVYQGWYIAVHPNETQGDSTSWYSSYWTFCSQFLDNKYKTIKDVDINLHNFAITSFDMVQSESSRGILEWI